MNISISGYKDTDREILLRLEDKDLLNSCIINKYFYNNVCDNNFFHKKLLRSYSDVLKYKMANMNYKQYYIKIVHYVSKLKKEFGYSYDDYNTGNPQAQYDIFRSIRYNCCDESCCDERLLCEAVEKGELELVKEAIKRDGNIHPFAETALKCASAHGHLEVVKYLVSVGADIHINDEEPLSFASSNGHLQVVKYLVSLGADIHAENEDALRASCVQGHLEVVKYLLSLGGDISANNGYALRWARINGHLELVKYLQSLQ